MLDTEKANICTVMNTFGFDVVSGGLAIRGVVDSLSAYRHESAIFRDCAKQDCMGFVRMSSCALLRGER